MNLGLIVARETPAGRIKRVVWILSTCCYLIDRPELISALPRIYNQALNYDASSSLFLNLFLFSIHRDFNFDRSGNGKFRFFSDGLKFFVSFFFLFFLICTYSPIIIS